MQFEADPWRLSFTRMMWQQNFKQNSDATTEEQMEKLQLGSLITIVIQVSLAF